MADNKGHNRPFFFEALVNHPLILLVSSDEVLKLVDSEGTAELKDIGEKFYTEAVYHWRYHGRNTFFHTAAPELNYDQYFALGAIFIAGRIQGIREERMRRKRGKITHEKNLTRNIHKEFRICRRSRSDQNGA